MSTWLVTARRCRASVILLLAMLPSTVVAQTTRYGIITPFNEQLEADYTRRLGVGSARFTLYWNETEPQQNNFSWGVLDLHLDLAIGQLGLSTLISVGERAPGWAAPCGSCAPYDYNYYGNFFEQVIRHTRARYPNADVVFGVWNEPDGVFLDDNANADVYKALFQQASAARDRVSSNIRIAGPETGSGALSYFDAAMFRMAPYMRPHDIVTVHWYPQTGDLSGFMDYYSRQSGGRKVWLTETGMNTCSDSEHEFWVRTIIQTLEETTSTNAANWRRAFIYRLRSGVNCGETLLRPDWSPRPAYNWYENYVNRRASDYTMTAGQVLLANQFVTSDDGRFTLVYQDDGNLVLYRWDGVSLWASNTENTPPGHTIMQDNGDFAVYDGWGNLRWHSNTGWSPGAYVALQNDGNLVVYRANGQVGWASGTCCY